MAVNPLILDDVPINNEILQKAEKNIKNDIPSSYIPIKLASNGRIKDVPNILHFRCFSASDALDLTNASQDVDKYKIVADILTRMCWEKFDCQKLGLQDLTLIIFTLQANFIGGEIEQEIYLNEDLEEGNEEGKLDHPSNKEIVSIPLSSINVRFLGKDENDNDISNFKSPFVIRDENDNAFRVKTPIVQDSILAEEYCKELYKDDYIKFTPIRKKIKQLQRIKDVKERQDELDTYLFEHEEECKDYFKFMNDFASKTAKIVQALQLIEFNGKPLNSLEDKLRCYVENTPLDVWYTYNKVLEENPFGLSNDIEVYSNKLGKKVMRGFQFTIDDFILQFNQPKTTRQCSVSFD